MIDIHSHILPGLDDGAATMEDTVELLRMARETGTTAIVASPHADTQYKFDPEKVDALISEARERAGLGLRIVRGCDFHLMLDNIQDALAHPTRYTINAGPYLLMELSDMMIFPNTGRMWQELEDAGMRIILTHPERNPLLQDQMDRIEQWVEQGRYMQLTAQSLLGQFGPKAHRFAVSMIEKGLAHFVASDGHDLRGRPPRLDRAFQWVAARYGRELAELLFVEHPRAVIAGEPVESWMPKPDRAASGGFLGRLFGR
ncbi:MAG: CpsB/CapC family capsule biosynthesis tyrosine phosphatase [Bryobacteraceae bacterium]|jgi:protein-tyrosine phosphatase